MVDRKGAQRVEVGGRWARKGVARIKEVGREMGKKVGRNSQRLRKEVGKEVGCKG